MFEQGQKMYEIPLTMDFVLTILLLCDIRTKQSRDGHNASLSPRNVSKDAVETGGIMRHYLNLSYPAHGMCESRHSPSTFAAFARDGNGYHRRPGRGRDPAALDDSFKDYRWTSDERGHDSRGVPNDAPRSKYCSEHKFFGESARECCSGVLPCPSGIRSCRAVLGG